MAEASCQLAVLGLVQPECVRVVETLEEAIEGADWVQENAPEALALKRDLDRRLEQIARPDVVLASSTSAFCWSELTDGMSTRSRLVTTHPFNPPHLIPLVEIYGTNADVVARAVVFYSDLGRRPVVLGRKAVGYIANRLSSALWREAVSLVADGVASPADVDAAWCMDQACAGRRLGPTLHTIWLRARAASKATCAILVPARSGGGRASALRRLARRCVKLWCAAWRRSRRAARSPNSRRCATLRSWQSWPLDVSPARPRVEREERGTMSHDEIVRGCLVRPGVKPQGPVGVRPLGPKVSAQ